MSRQESWSPDVFDRLYRERRDPWGFETSAYERDKYADTLAQLAGRRYASGLELGCSIGVLSRILAPCCDRLLALDAAAAAIDAARRRCAGLGHVSFERAVLPMGWPEGAFDLILVSELLYFLSPSDVGEVAGRCASAARPRCTILLVNWTGRTDTPTTGDEAATLFAAAFLRDPQASGFSADLSLRRPGYRLDRLRRRQDPG